MKKIVLKGDAISRDAADGLLTVFTCDENQSERTRIISVWIKEVSERECDGTGLPGLPSSQEQANAAHSLII